MLCLRMFFSQNDLVASIYDNHLTRYHGLARPFLLAEYRLPLKLPETPVFPKKKAITKIHLLKEKI
jgi:hypothetical protein